MAHQPETRTTPDLLHDESGATSLEYGLIATAVGVTIVIGVGLYTGTLQRLWAYVWDSVLQAL